MSSNDQILRDYMTDLLEDVMIAVGRSVHNKFEATRIKHQIQNSIETAMKTYEDVQFRAQPYETLINACFDKMNPEGLFNNDLKFDMNQYFKEMYGKDFEMEDVIKSLAISDEEKDKLKNFIEKFDNVSIKGNLQDFLKEATDNITNENNKKIYQRLVDDFNNKSVKEIASNIKEKKGNLVYDFMDEADKELAQKDINKITANLKNGGLIAMSSAELAELSFYSIREAGARALKNDARKILEEFDRNGSITKMKNGFLSLGNEAIKLAEYNKATNLQQRMETTHSQYVEQDKEKSEAYIKNQENKKKSIEKVSIDKDYYKNLIRELQVMSSKEHTKAIDKYRDDLKFLEINKSVSTEKQHLADVSLLKKNFEKNSNQISTYYKDLVEDIKDLEKGIVNEKNVLFVNLSDKAMKEKADKLIEKMDRVKLEKLVEKIERLEAKGIDVPNKDGIKSNEKIEVKEEKTKERSSDLVRER